MYAAFTQSYGPATVLDVRDVPERALEPRELRVEVHASPVTAGDLRLRSADFPGVSAPFGRLLMGVFAPRNKVQGTMFAGRVVEVGAAVERFAVGDAVFGSVDAGAWAERLIVAEDGSVALRPDGVSDAQAAATPYGAGTSRHFLVDLADVQPGERVLVLGASGGVGRYAIQVARHLGAHVTAVGSPDTHALMRRLGAHEVLDYHTQDFTRMGVQYDVVFDIADASSFSHSRPVLTDTGRYMTLFISLRVMWDMLWTRLRGGPRALFSVATGDQEGTAKLARWLAEGVVRPVLAGHYPLGRIAEAHVAAESGAHGDIVVQPSALVHSPVQPMHAAGVA